MVTPATMLGGLVGESTLKLIGKLWPFAIMAGLVVALLLTRAALADKKLDLEKERAAHAETIANYKLAQEAATVKAERARRDQEAEYRRNADEAEDRYAQGLADAGARAEQFIRDNRVRPQGANCPSSGAAASAGGERAGVPAPVPAAPELVGVTPEDVRACAAAVTYADKAHEWAMTLNPKP